LCSQQRIFSVHSRKRGLNRKPGPPVHDDLLERNFTAATIRRQKGLGRLTPIEYEIIHHSTTQTVSAA
jgi:hypothetical protein